MARRCPFGYPAVTEQSPYDDEGKPFPTGYWLTCPHLVAAVSRLEAAGGVERWSERAGSSRRLAWSLRRAGRKQRRRRKKLAPAASQPMDGGASLELGIAGVEASGRLKCLHAHVAFSLANRGYRLGRLMEREIEPLWPQRCCTDSRGCGSEGGSERT